jgi:hypothetical protein
MSLIWLMDLVERAKRAITRVAAVRRSFSDRRHANSIEPSRQAHSNQLRTPADLADLAPLVRRMAETGDGTDACLELGCLPLPVHFYSPVPDIKDLQKRNVWNRRSDLLGIDMRVPRQLEFLQELGREFGSECRWPHEYRGNDHEFYTDNSGFSFGCAAGAHMLIRKCKPRRVVEVGSGSSTRVIANALRANAAVGAPAAHYTVIDPYPTDATRTLTGITAVVAEKVECVEPAIFECLKAHDVLFVDSGHTVRIGGDVNFLILEVLPRLARGVLVHFHDIPMPYEYASAYFTNPKFRMFWTESYLLQAFLAFNSVYEILLAMNLLMLEHIDAFKTALPSYDPAVHKYASHSFWMRRHT